ncbi:MAG: AmmeMemoRadiSam system protein B [Deltaproteobacteria bacterium]|nr:AmmeMemoRadiSam system protein B [Deltaproteobacteria bacterium]
MIRTPCVVGRFYPSKPDTLRKNVRGFLVERTREKAIAIVAPHAGYMYSGAVAGEVYSSVVIPDDIILIGPNHTGMGKKVSVMSEGEWDTPLGRLKVNSKLAELILGGSRLFSSDIEAHLEEHSLEVQLPFIHELNKNASIVPITVMTASANDCAELGRALAGAISSYAKEVLIVVSSDMNHFESDKKTRVKDIAAIEAVLKLDAGRLLEVTSSRDITMCGVLPAAIAIEAARALGATEARLIRYSTSGETSGDFDHVVGYAGIVIK